ncbi:MAG: hypothetical protein HOG49_39120 [Candidatus Scalindua sp.]|mgnify:CR=1|jgi:hypothetical protein|nr:hypothetical protein [Candidatus Scalindua sp.]
MKKKVTMSFEQSRKAILTQMTSNAKGKAQKKVIHFRNDDVPTFLKNLNDFEKQSRKNRINVK